MSDSRKSLSPGAVSATRWQGEYALLNNSAALEVERHDHAWRWLLSCNRRIAILDRVVRPDQARAGIIASTSHA